MGAREGWWTVATASGGEGATGGARPARYRDFRFLARNQLSETYRAHDSACRRDVLFKVFRSPVVAHTDRLRRLEAEAARLAAVDNPFVVPLFHFQVCQGFAYAVMGAVDGMSLLDCVDRCGLGTRDIVRLGCHVASGLAALHQAGVFVRDFGPDTVVVGTDGCAHLVDVGLARYLGVAGMSTTQSGYLVGVPGYTAPELLRGGPTTEASEVFSAAVLLYRALVGHLPFDTEAVEAAARHGVVPAMALPSATCEAGDEGLDDVFGAALALDAEQRIQSAAELGHALAGWLGDSLDRMTRQAAPDGMSLGGRVRTAPTVAAVEPTVVVPQRAAPAAPTAEATSAAERLLAAKGTPRFTDSQFLARSHLVETYRAIDRKLGGQVVVKVVRKDVTGKAQRLERLVAEVTALATVRNEHVDPMLDAGGHGDLVYVVLPELAGWPLLEAIDAFKLRAREVVLLGSQLADALAAVHAASVLHRDVKPDCVLVDRHGCLKLADFGLAMYVGTLGFHCTSRSGYLLDPSPYTAPEVVAGGNSTAASDVFSLGVVLYEALTGRLPYEAGAIALYALGDQGLELSVQDPSTIVPAVDGELSAVLLATIALERDRRPATAASVRDGLRAWLDTHGAGRRIGWLFGRDPQVRPKVFSVPRPSGLQPDEDDDDEQDVGTEIAPLPDRAATGAPTGDTPTGETAAVGPPPELVSPADHAWARQVALLVVLVLLSVPVAVACGRLAWRTGPESSPDQPVVPVQAQTKTPGGTLGDRLAAAVAAGDGEAVAALVAAGADPSAIDGTGAPVLQGAAAGGSLAVVQALLAGGARADGRAADGTTALHAAARRGSDAVVRALLAAGATVSAGDARGDTALHVAAAAGRLEVVEALLDGEASPNALNAGGVTPLHVAARDGRRAVVASLMRRGGRADLRDAEGLTPRDWAHRAGQDGVTFDAHH